MKYLLSIAVAVLSVMIIAVTLVYGNWKTQVPDGPTVVFQNGYEISLLDTDKNELWRFKSTDGNFFRHLTEKSMLTTDRELLFVSTRTSVLAIDLKSGKKVWSYKLLKPSELAICAEIVVAGDRVLVSINQISAPLVCLDKTTGKQIWRYPGKDSDARLGFGPVAIKDATVLFNATVKQKGVQGYVYENQALNLVTGKRVAWPSKLKKVPKQTVNNRLATVFAGKSRAPKNDGDLFIGILKTSPKGYVFERPEFYSGLPLYRFTDADKAKFEKLLDKKVEIRGEIVSIAESLPPIITVKVLEIRSLAQQGGDKDKEAAPGK